MKLDHFLIGNAGELMQPVDVLGDDAGDLALGNEMRDCAMSAVWLSLLEHLFEGQLAAPSLATHVFPRKKVIKVDRLIGGPEAAGAAEIGNPGFGADAGAGKDDDSAACFEKLGQVVDQAR